MHLVDQRGESILFRNLRNWLEKVFLFFFVLFCSFVFFLFVVANIRFFFFLISFSFGRPCILFVWSLSLLSLLPFYWFLYHSFVPSPLPCLSLGIFNNNNNELKNKKRLEALNSMMKNPNNSNPHSILNRLVMILMLLSVWCIQSLRLCLPIMIYSQGT